MPMNVIVIFIFHNNMCVGYARPLHIMCVNLRCKARPLETALNVNQAKDKHSYSSGCVNTTISSNIYHRYIPIMHQSHLLPHANRAAAAVA